MENNKDSPFGFVHKIYWPAVILIVLTYVAIAFLFSYGRVEQEISYILFGVLTFLAVMTSVGLLLLRIKYEPPKIPKMKDFIIWCFIESIVLYGLALSILTKVFVYTFTSSIPTLILFYLYAPKQND